MIELTGKTDISIIIVVDLNTLLSVMTGQVNRESVRAYRIQST